MPPDNQSAAPTVSAKDFVGSEMLEPGEEMVLVVRRTVIGLVLIYLEALAVVIAILAIAFFIAPDVFNSSSDQTKNLVLGGTLFAVTLLVLVLFVSTYVYRQSRLLVTDRSLVEVLQKSLFVRKISRLSMSNVEDVSAEQRGILPTIFNYGTLIIQTAGEMDNFVFPWCPDPNNYAHQILEARQKYALSLEEEQKH